MSNLLDKASILLTPTAYNDGRMLSVKPEVAFGSELVTSFTNGTSYPLDTFVSSGNNITSLIKSNGFGGCVSNGSSYTANDKVIVSFTYTKNSGDNLRVLFSSVVTGAGVSVSNNINISESGDYTLYFTILSTTTAYLQLGTGSGSASINGSITNVSAKKDLSGDFTFSRSSAATRVNAQGLVENVQIISSELVSNGNFSQIGTEEVSNGNFSQEGSEEIVNGSFDTDSDWTLSGSNVSISGGKLNFVNATSNSEFAQQSIVAPIGKTYKITLDVSNLGSGESIKIRYPFQDITINTNGTHILYGVGNIANFFRLTPNSSTASFSIDNVSVKEVGQDWTLQAGWSIGDGVATCDGTNLTQLYQTNVLTQNKLYKVTYSITSHISGGVFAKLGDNILGEINSTVGTYTEYFNFTQANLSFHFRSSNFIGSISNISVKEVGQDWTFGTGWSIGDGVAESTALSTRSVFQNLGNAVVGKKYKITYTILETNGGNFKLVYGGVNGTIRNSVGTYTEIITATSSSDSNVYFDALNVMIGKISNISVKEITDDTDLPRINYEGFSYQDSLGSELVVNGGFDTDSNWNKTQATISNGEANISSDGSYTAIDQSNVSVIGKNYFYSINVKSITGTMQFRLGSGTDVDITTIGIKTGYIVATSTTLEIKRKSGAGAINATIDNVSVKEVLGQEVVPDSGCGSWLLEGQSTNIIPYSESLNQTFTNNSTSGDGSFTITPNYGISPDGTQNATRIQLSASSGSFADVAHLTSLLNGTYTYSVYVKALSGTPTMYLIYNGSSSIIKTISNDWVRYTFTFTHTGSVIPRFLLEPNGGTSTSADILAWGAQLEAQSYATSYIPTNGATNTRLQDIANNSGNSNLINSTEGVLYAEIAALSSPVDSPKNITISDGTVNNYVRIEYYQDGRVYGNVYDGTSVAANFVVNQLNFNKVAIQYSSSGSKLYVNGTGVDFASKIFTSNTLNTIQFSSAAADSNYFYGKNKALAVYKEALTDANLRSLTYPNPVATTFDLDFDTIAEQFTFTRGSEATFVNAQGLIESTASNDAPRIDYSTGAKAFLLENQSTNLITQSELFSDSYWTKGGSSVVSGFTSPSGV